MAICRCRPDTLYFIAIRPDSQAKLLSVNASPSDSNPARSAGQPEINLSAVKGARCQLPDPTPSPGQVLSDKPARHKTIPSHPASQPRGHQNATVVNVNCNQCASLCPMLPFQSVCKGSQLIAGSWESLVCIQGIKPRSEEAKAYRSRDASRAVDHTSSTKLWPISHFGLPDQK